MDFRDYDTRLAAYALVVDDGRVLLALWNEGVEPEWTLPGGGVDLDESVAETAVREVREETGYDVALGRVLGVDSFVVPIVVARWSACVRTRGTVARRGHWQATLLPGYGGGGTCHVPSGCMPSHVAETPTLRSSGRVA